MNAEQGHNTITAIQERPQRSSRAAMSSTLRCLGLMEVLARDPYSFSLTEISGILNIAKSSAHRFLSTLIAAGLVKQDPSTHRYELAGKALWIGTAYLRHSAVYRCGYVSLESLAQAANTTAHLGVWDNDSVLYLHTAGPPRSLSLFTEVGERRPLHCSAIGKAMLAYRSEVELERIAQKGLQRYTEKTITSVSCLSEELNRVRELGYALDNEEVVAGLRCVAAPIRGHDGNAIAGVSLSAPTNTVTDAELPHFSRLVQEAALRVSVQLGYRPYTGNLDSLIGPGKTEFSQSH